MNRNTRKKCENRIIVTHQKHPQIIGRVTVTELVPRTRSGTIDQATRGAIVLRDPSGQKFLLDLNRADSVVIDYVNGDTTTFK